MALQQEATSTFPVHHMVKQIVILCILAVVFLSHAACNGKKDSSMNVEPTRIQAHLQEVMAIGNDEGASQDYLLGNPKFVQTSSNGNIFIADEAIFGIRVYSPSGMYLQTIGKHGEGPGELKRISSFTINRMDQVLVADHLNQRITVFSEDGDLINTFSYSRAEKIDTPRRMVHLEDDRYLFFFKLSGEEPHDNMAHVVSLGDSIKEEMSFISFRRDLRFSGVAAKRLIQSGRAWLVDTKNLLFIPQLHSGTIYRYRYNPRTEGWDQVAPLRGYVEIEAPLEELDPTNYDPDKVFYKSRGPEGLRVGVFNNQSFGVFSMRNHHVVHFFYNLMGDTRVFGVELFDETGKLLGHSPIPVINGVEEVYFPYEVAWKDQHDHFYIIDRRGTPVVRVVDLEYTLKEM